LNDFDALSRKPLVVLATSLGRDTCGNDEVEELAEEDNTATIQYRVASWSGYSPLSAADLAAELTPATFAAEYLAKETGLNEASLRPVLPAS
jgi:hypothetical protein